MSRFDDRLTRDLQRIADQAKPSRPELESILERAAEDTGGGDGVVIRLDSRPEPRFRRGLPALVAAVVALIVATTLVLTGGEDDPGSVLTDQPTVTLAPTAVPQPTASPTAAPAPDRTPGAVPVDLENADWARQAGIEAGFDPGQRLVFESVAFGDGLFVAAGSVERSTGADGFRGGAEIWTSDDGRSWTRADTPDSQPGGVIYDITFNQGVFVAVGERSDGAIGAPPAGAGTAWTSPDGRTWTRRSPAEWAQFTPVAITSTPDGYLAVGATGRFEVAIWSSADGTEWTQVAGFRDPLGIALADITAGPDGYVAVGRYGEQVERHGLVLWSSDGTRWDELPRDEDVFPADSELTDVAGSPEWGFIAVGMDFASSLSASLWTSANGQDWRRWPSQEDGPQTIISDISTGPEGAIVAVGGRAADALVWQIERDGEALALTPVESFGIAGPEPEATGLEIARGVTFGDNAIVVIGYRQDGDVLEAVTWSASPS